MTLNQIRNAIRKRKIDRENIEFAELCVEFVDSRKFPQFVTLLHVWNECKDKHGAGVGISEIANVLADMLNYGEITEDDIMDMTYSEMIDLCY